MKIENIKCVHIDESRWQTDLTIEHNDGTIEQFVASADSAYADSGIWFGTLDEFEERKADQW